MLVACRCHHPQSWLHPSHLAHEEGLKRAGSVVPPETLAVSVPQLQTMLLLPILIPELENICQVKIDLLSLSLTMKASLTNHGHPFINQIRSEDTGSRHEPLIWMQHKVLDSLEVVGLPGVPVLVGDGFPGGHPEELALLGLVSAWCPEVLVSHAWKNDH